ncbi:MAG TPA: hypothetical protein IAC12_03805 [Candidatus Aphodovivens avistercoris]|nr:hypothetical protein [Candidatus Aphodovivens avistercoris]
MDHRPDYAFYSEQYGGSLDEKSFDAALPHALAEVRRLTWPNDPSLDEAAYMRAVCAAVEVDAAYGCTGGAGSLQSVTVGSVSMGFGSQGGEASYSADMARAVRGELAGTGLLFMGVGS